LSKVAPKISIAVYLLLSYTAILFVLSNFSQPLLIAELLNGVLLLMVIVREASALQRDIARNLEALSGKI
ncbi:MAG: hypothetical protein M3R15_21785, partial [Acidobacteriota bacterium]|nr:hypothetical protein [Acidobacteriota bacterium]